MFTQKLNEIFEIKLKTQKATQKKIRSITVCISIFLVYGVDFYQQMTFECMKKAPAHRFDICKIQILISILGKWQ